MTSNKNNHLYIKSVSEAANMAEQLRDFAQFKRTPGIFSGVKQSE